jgi:hypothetical protein
MVDDNSLLRLYTAGRLAPALSCAPLFLLREQERERRQREREGGRRERERVLISLS